MIDPSQDPVWRGFALYVAVGALCLLLQQTLLTPLAPWLPVQPLVALCVHAGFRRGPREAIWAGTALGILWDVMGSGLFGAAWFRLMIVLVVVHLARRFFRDSVAFLVFTTFIATAAERIVYVVETAGFAGWEIDTAGVLARIPAAGFLNALLALGFVFFFDRVFRTRMFRLVQTGIDMGGYGSS